MFLRQTGTCLLNIISPKKRNNFWACLTVGTFYDTFEISISQIHQTKTNNITTNQSKIIICASATKMFVKLLK